MSKAAELRIGAAPICWGVCHIEGWGYQMTPERVFDEMRRVGVAATETVPHGWLPDDPQEARDLLTQWGIQITSGYVPLVLYRGEDAWREELKSTGTWLAELGAEVLMIGALDESETYDRRPELSDEDWKSLLGGLDAASDAAKELGLTAAVHPHLGTTVERAEDIERVLDGSKISFCLDTGHVYIGEADPGDLARRAADRIAYVHLKDVDPVLTERYRSGELDFLGAVREGIFLPLGKGAVDIASVVQPLVAHGYSGWYMIEQDVMLQSEPAPGEGPTADTQWSKRALEDIVRSMGSAL